MEWKERKITSGEYGHFLNPVQSWSPKDIWIVYDTRNEDSHIGRTGRIERLHVETGRIDTLYQTQNQSIYGPGVGAAAYSPVQDRVIFIHGLQNCDANQPYGVTRRSGLGLSFGKGNKVFHYDARDIALPFTIGALRGGSHAHSWSGDGKWISFTYNDAVMEAYSKTDNSAEDLRMVGVMTPWGGVEVKGGDRDENFNGTMFTMVVTRVTENPTWGSDEISKAYEDGWIGRNGYVDTSSKRHSKAIAFLGDVRDEGGQVVTEVFVVDLPDEEPDLSTEAQLKGTATTRLQPLSMVHQRRVTYTTDRKYPGVQGPRQWMKSSPDGSLLYFMMKDSGGLVQIYSVPTKGGEIRAVTNNEFSIETSFDIDPTGERIAYGADEKIYVTDMASGRTTCLTPAGKNGAHGLRAIQWSYDGNHLAYNRKVQVGDTAFFQVFVLTRSKL